MVKISAKIIIEVLGAPKEHVEETIKIVVEKVKESKYIKVNSDNIHETREVEGKPLFSTFVELNIETGDIEDLIGFCFDFMPSSIDILEPDHLDIDAVKLNNLLNDLLAKLHQYDAALKMMNMKNIVLQREVDALKGEKKD